MSAPDITKSASSQTDEPRTTRGHATKKRIIDSATRLIHANGYKNTSLEDILTVAEIKPPREFIGRTLMALELRKRYGINVIVIKQPAPNQEGTDEKDIKLTPTPDYTISESDVMVVVGETDAIEALH